MEQEDHITRSDIATIRRAIFDLKYYVNKRKEDITSDMINITSSSKYSDQLFIELGNKSNILSHFQMELRMLLRLLDTPHIKSKELYEEELSDKEISEIRYLFKTKLYSCEELMLQYSISNKTTNCICSIDFPSSTYIDEGSMLSDIKELFMAFKRFVSRLLLSELKRKD